MACETVTLGSPMGWRVQNSFLTLCDTVSLWDEMLQCRARARSADSYLAKRVAKAWSCTIPVSPLGRHLVPGADLAGHAEKDGSIGGGTSQSTMEDEPLGGEKGTGDGATKAPAAKYKPPGADRSGPMSEDGSVDADDHTRTSDSRPTAKAAQARGDTRPASCGTTNDAVADESVAPGSDRCHFATTDAEDTQPPSPGTTMDDAMADESVARQSDRWQDATTAMLRNLPWGFTQEDVAGVLDANGLKGKYDFIYLPRVHTRAAKKKQSNFGYVFINFTQQEFAEACRYIFDGRPVKANSARLLEVIPADIQGKANLCRNFAKKFRKSCGPWLLTPEASCDTPDTALRMADCGLMGQATDP